MGALKFDRLRSNECVPFRKYDEGIKDEKRFDRLFPGVSLSHAGPFLPDSKVMFYSDAKYLTKMLTF